MNDSAILIIAKKEIIFAGFRSADIFELFFMNWAYIVILHKII